jgi:hypothetical protein
MDATPPFEYTLKLSFGLFILGAGLVGSCRFRRQAFRIERDSYVAPLLVSVGGLAFWFVTAPAPRFDYGYLFSLR